MGWHHDKDAWLPDQQAWARAGGRRRYQSVRRLRATLRRVAVFRLWQQQVRQSDIARRLKVHRSTISRDIRALYIALSMAAPGVTMGSAIRRVPPRRQW